MDGLESKFSKQIDEGNTQQLVQIDFELNKLEERTEINQELIDETRDRLKQLS